MDTSRKTKVITYHYKGNKIDAGYRLDILIPNKLIIELKAVERTLPIHTAQLITYLKLSDIKTGLLINFNLCGFNSPPLAA